MADNIFIITLSARLIRFMLRHYHPALRYDFINDAFGNRNAGAESSMWLAISIGTACHASIISGASYVRSQEKIL